MAKAKIVGNYPWRLCTVSNWSRSLSKVLGLHAIIILSNIVRESTTWALGNLPFVSGTGRTQVEPEQLRSKGPPCRTCSRTFRRGPERWPMPASVRPREPHRGPCPPSGRSPFAWRPIFLPSHAWEHGQIERLKKGKDKMISIKVGKSG